MPHLIAAEGAADQPVPVFGRLVEGATAGPPGFCRGPMRLRQVGEVRPRGVVGEAAGLGGLLGLRLLADAKAIALAMSSSLRSGRWLGGLRFEMAGDSWGKGLISSMATARPRGNASQGRGPIQPP